MYVERSISLFINVSMQTIAPPPPPPAIITSLQAGSHAQTGADQELSNWLNVVERYAAAINLYSAETEVEVLSYWIGVIKNETDGNKTNIKWLNRQSEKIVSESIPILRDCTQHIQRVSRALSTAQHPDAAKANIALGKFKNAVEAFTGTFSGLPAAGRRILERAVSMHRVHEHSTDVYGRAIQHILKDEDVSWKLHHYVDSDPFECFPWYEIKVSEPQRRDRKKLRLWERNIAKAVEEVNPSLVGTVAINYSVVSGD